MYFKLKMAATLMNATYLYTTYFIKDHKKFKPLDFFIFVHNTIRYERDNVLNKLQITKEYIIIYIGISFRCFKNSSLDYMNIQ